ncbi:hypothetical protein ACEPAH_3336 [Sanghuangporus vaninii]
MTIVTVVHRIAVESFLVSIRPSLRSYPTMSVIDEARVKNAIQKLIDLIRETQLFSCISNLTSTVEEYIIRLAESVPTILVDFSSASVWNSWRTSVLKLKDVHASPVVADPLELRASPSNFDWKEIEAILMTVKYPGKLRRLEVPAYPEIEQQDYFIQDIIDWSRGVQSDAWDDDIPAVVLNLFAPWLTTRRALENKAYEIMQRTLVDTMLRWVFSERTSDQLKHTVCEEQDVLLPVNPNASVQITQAKADSFITRQLPIEVSDALGEAIAPTTVPIKALNGNEEKEWRSRAVKAPSMLLAFRVREKCSAFRIVECTVWC